LTGKLAEFSRDCARRDFLGYSIFVRHWRADFRNLVVAVERPGIWQLSLGRGVDSFQFHGRPGVGKRDRRIIKNSAMAAPSSLRCTGGVRGSVWLHNRIWSSAAWRFAAAGLADAVGLPAYAAWIAFRAVVPHPARADNSHGSDAARVD